MHVSGMFRAAMFLAFSQELRRLDVGVESDVATFSEVVRNAIDDYGVQPGAISSEFGVTRATVSRWRSGEAMPGLYMRRQLVEWLADITEAQATSGDPSQQNRIFRLVENAAAL